MSGDTAAPADAAFAPREAAGFRARLALRVAIPLDRPSRAAALKVTGSAALAAPPVLVARIAPTATLTPGAVVGLVCAALPGIAATAWTSAALREARRLKARALRQAGAEHRTAWLMAAGRLSLFAAIGALLGCVWVAAAHKPLGSVLPKHSPLHGMFAAGIATWIFAVVLTCALATGGALLASSPVWTRVDWSKLAAPFTRLAHLPMWQRLSALRGARPPR